jgi:hypothetical protein
MNSNLGRYRGIPRQHRHWWRISAIISGGMLLLGVFASLLSCADRLPKAAKTIFRKTISARMHPLDMHAYIQHNSLLSAGLPQSLPAAGPLRVHPENPRYFMDRHGQAVYLVGSHTWLNLQDAGVSDPPPSFDYATWLDFLQSQHHNFFRLWHWEQAKWGVEWSRPYYFDPLPYHRTGPINEPALDGKPKFDLTRFNQAYFDRMRQRVIAAGQRGIYVSIMLFNGWSVSYPKGQAHKAMNPWRGHPYNVDNNINGINGDPNGDNSGVEVHELTEARITTLQEAYVRKVIDTVNDLDNVLYEISNESHTMSIAWQYHMIDYIHSYQAGKLKQHPVGMTAIWPHGNNADLYASNADWISPNGDLYKRPAADDRKVVVADTDHLCGICGDATWVWMSFARGEHPLFMDQYDDSYQLNGGGYAADNPNDVSLRKNLGYTRLYAARMNLAAMVPHGELATSGYVLANRAMSGAEYLVFVLEEGSVTVDLTQTRGVLNVEWFNPSTGQTTAGGTSMGGASRLFQAPFRGDAVLYLYERGAETVQE